MINQKHTLDKLLIVAILITPLIMYVLSTYIFPRPYWLMSSDYGHDYYYNAKNIFNNYGNINSYHPGTPIYYLSALLLAITGDEPNKTENFFRLGHLLIAFINTISLVFFWRLILYRKNISIILSSIVFFLSFPGLWSYQDNYSSVSFINSLGLITISIFYYLVQSTDTISKIKIILLGFSSSLCLATNVSFILLAFSMNLSFFFYNWSNKRTSLVNLNTFLILPVSTIIFFFVLCYPIIDRIHYAISPILVELGNPGNNVFYESFLYLIGHNPVFFPLLIVIIFYCFYFFSKLMIANKGDVFKIILSNSFWYMISISFLVPLLILIVRELKNPFLFENLSGISFKIFIFILISFLFSIAVILGLKKIRNLFQANYLNHKNNNYILSFEKFPFGLFLFLNSIFFIILALKVDSGINSFPGRDLRKIIPLGSYFPFLIIFLYETIPAFLKFNKIPNYVLKYSKYFSIIILGASLFFHISQRNSWININLANHNVFSKDIKNLIPKNSIVAFWTNDASSLSSFREISFHYWGNYRYGKENYNLELINSYPNYRWIRLRHLSPELRSSGRDYNQNTNFKSKLFYDIDSGENIILMIPQLDYQMEIENYDLITKFEDLITEETNLLSNEKKLIGGQSWIIMEATKK